jgi:3-oxoacyl-ACP reductase-like protein
MEEILVDDVSDKCATETPAAVLSSCSSSGAASASTIAVAAAATAAATAAAAAAAATATATATATAVDDPSSRVMSMLYIQQGKLHANQVNNNNNNNPSQPLVHVVNKSQIAAFNQVRPEINQAARESLHFTPRTNTHAARTRARAPGKCRLL